MLLNFLSYLQLSSETTVKVESAMAMRSLQPQIKAIQQRYAGDQVTFCSPSSLMECSFLTKGFKPLDTQEKQETICGISYSDP